MREARVGVNCLDGAISGWNSVLNLLKKRITHTLASIRRRQGLVSRFSTEFQPEMAPSTYFTHTLASLIP